jgi:HSP20 family protein
MENVQAALNEVKELYKEVLGTPAPDISPNSYVAFPPGVDPIDHAMEEVKRLKALSEQMAAAPTLSAWAPPADMYTTSDGLIIYMELGGVEKEDLKVLVAGGECIVRGERKFVPGPEVTRPVSIERPWGKLERRFVLPPGVNPERVTARYRNGILELRIAGDGSGIPGEMTVEVA